MEECCDICGDIGVEDAILVCSQCEKSREHRYCMQIYPNEPPTLWCCEVCESANRTTRNFGTVNDFGLAEGDSRRGKGLIRNLPGKKQTQFLPPMEVIKLASGEQNIRPSRKVTVRSSLNSPKPPASYPQNTSIISRDNSQKPPIIHVKQNPSLGPSEYQKLKSVGSFPTDVMAAKRDAIPAVTKSLLSTPFKPRYIALNPSSHYVKANPSQQCLQQMQLVEVDNVRNTAATSDATRIGMVQGPVKGDIERMQVVDAPLYVSKIEATPKEVDQRHTDGMKVVDASVDVSKVNAASKEVDKDIHRTSLSQPSASCRQNPTSHQDPVLSGHIACDKMEVGTSNAENRESAIQPADTSLYIPARCPSWKGNFKFLTNSCKLGGFGDEIQAYPPSRVHRKVYEFSKQMPDVLQFELVPRVDLWVNLFQNYSPDKDDIALYFFPCNIDRSDNYMLLLESMQRQDLVMRNCMQDVVLLVFQSKLLQRDSQRWNGEHYLWGLFYHLGNVKDAALEDNQGDDMDIDMIGGQAVGTVDIVVHKPQPKGEIIREEIPSIILKGAEVNPPVSAKLPCQSPRLFIKTEPCDDVPPGFAPLHVRRPPTKGK